MTEIEPPVAAQWQTTRYIRLANNRDEKVMVNLTYTTLDVSGEVVEGTLEVELEAGEQADLFQEDWQVNAMLVRFRATGAGGTVIRRMQDGPVVLVPETDDEGNPGYASSIIQTSVISIR